MRFHVRQGAVDRIADAYTAGGDEICLYCAKEYLKGVCVEFSYCMCCRVWVCKNCYFDRNIGRAWCLNCEEID